jgi:AraC-like DNA-binding protein
LQNHNYLRKLRKLEELIERNFLDHKSAGEYARLMNLSEKHLNRICKTCLHKTVTEVISDRIILEAKRMLIFSNIGVAETSAELGYLDTSYFCRCFKKKTGKTPADFIKQFRRQP